MEIISPANSKFRIFESLTTSKGIEKEGLFLLSGENLVREFLAKPQKVEAVAEIVPYDRQAISSLQNYIFSKKLFNQIDVIGTHFNILVVQLPEIKPWKGKEPLEGLELVVPLGDPGNLGACLRSSEAFEVSKVILTQEAAHPFLPKSVKASSGSCYRVPLFQGPSLKDIEFGIGLDSSGVSLFKYQWSKNSRLVVGEEGRGLAGRGRLGGLELVSIPTQQVESLNAVVATSIALFHYRSQHQNI